MSDVELVTSIPQGGDCSGVASQDLTSIGVSSQHRVLVTFKRTSGPYDLGEVALARKSFVI